jgi:TonB-dependent SusC/RagA subfamily outer membrane receptor
MSMRRRSCALAVAAGVILVSGGCARDVLAPQARGETGVTSRTIGPAPVGIGQQPLFIVDGVEIEAERGRLEGLNAAGIHSIEVIKGPAAVHIYGTKARSGAIVITTKDGAGQ